MATLINPMRVLKGSTAALLFGTVFALSSNVRAETLISGTATEEAWSFSVIPANPDSRDSWDREGSTYSYSLVRVPEEELSKGFKQAFSSLGDEVVTVFLQAPAGKEFEVAAPVGFESVELTLGWSAGRTAYFYQGRFETTALVQLGNHRGDPVSFEGRAGFNGPGGDAAGVSARAVLAAGQTFRFRSILVTFTIPESYDVDYDTIVDQFRLFANASRNDDEPTEDPGQWFRLVDEALVYPGPTAGQRLMRKQLSSRLKRMERMKLRLKAGGDPDGTREIQARIRLLRKRLMAM